jgi:hypothetical protein
VQRPHLLLTLLAAITGCGREPSFRDVQKGRVALEEAERVAIEKLLDQAEISPRKLALQGTGHGVLTIEDRHVTELHFNWRLQDPAPLASLTALRKLQLGGPRFASLRHFGSHPALTELDLGGFFGQVDSIEGLEGCAQLRRISVRGPLRTLAPLASCPGLEAIYLDGAAIPSLDTLPPLAKLALLSIGSAQLMTSLAGLESAPGLEELILIQARELREPAGLPPLAALRRLEIREGGLTSLQGLPTLPALEALVIEKTPLTSLTLPSLPALELLDLPANAIEELALPLLPTLASLDLSGNPLRDLEGLGQQPKLAAITLADCPVEDLTPLLDLPTLDTLDIRDTEVVQVPRELYERQVYLQMDEAQIEANAWEKSLREAWREEGFVERLPGGSGLLKLHQGSCKWQAGTFQEAKLTCSKTAESLSGFLYIGLTDVDPLMPTLGGPSRVRLRVTLSVTEGVARVYVRDRIDFKRLGEALAGYTDSSKPLISFGDQRDPEDYRDGYRFAEAHPGRPATVSGEAGIFFDQVVIWLEAVGGTARGIEYTVEPP